MPRTAKRQKLDSASMSPCPAPAPALDPVLGLELQGVEPDELASVGGLQVWAPALVWLWTSLGRCAHPESLEAVPEAEIDAVARAAIKACGGSVTGPARFLCFLGVGEVHTEAELRQALRGLRAAPAQRLAAVLADKLDGIKDLILSHCTLDAVHDAQTSLQTLCISWLWLYDALWGQLVRLDAPLALSRMLHTALPAFRDALQQSWWFHPLVLAPLTRHVLFLEEYVCRAALGTLQEAGPWRYERFGEALYAPGLGRGQRAGFAAWPLGPRSQVCVVQHCSANELAYLETQLERSPLVEASVAPPLAEAPRPVRPMSAAILNLLQRELGENDLLSGISIHPIGALSLGHIIGLHPSSVETFDLQLLNELEGHAPMNLMDQSEQEQEEEEEEETDDDSDVMY